MAHKYTRLPGARTGWNIGQNVKSGEFSNNHVLSCFVTDAACVLSRHPPTALVRHGILLLAHFGGSPRYRSLLFALHHRLFALHLG